MVNNLLSNAIKFTPEGGKVGLVFGSSGERVWFSVWDTGPGIAPALQEQIFERFYRAEEAEKAAIQGVGLGLSLVKSLVELHAGEIQLDSEPGEGSRFTIVLPRYKS